MEWPKTTEQKHAVLCTCVEWTCCRPQVTPVLAYFLQYEELKRMRKPGTYYCRVVLNEEDT